MSTPIPPEAPQADSSNPSAKLPTWLHMSDIQGLSQLATQGVLGVAGLAEAVQGRKVETASGLAGGTIHPLQEAFMEHFAAQCGYCTPGMLMSAKVLLDRNPSPTRAEVIEAIAGNLCRCTGYEPIIDAIMATAGTRRLA